MNNLHDLKAFIAGNRFIEDTFSVLGAVSRYAANGSDIARDLVIRCLARRNEVDERYGNIIDELAMRVGLHPYVENIDKLSLRSALTHAGHRADGIMSEYVLHASQASVLSKLMAGQSVILSAPTSFGKSLLIDVLISAKEFDNIVLIVPTLALVEETRRRMAKFSTRYSIITTSSQTPSDRNIFVFTQERYLGCVCDLPSIDFFAIDEFYKLAIQDDNPRSTQLNHAFLKLFETGAQFYLLGPAIHAIPAAVQKWTNCVFVVETFQTVVVELHLVDKKRAKKAALNELLTSIEGQTLVYCQSPSSTRRVLSSFLETGKAEISTDPELIEAANWTGANYHDQWLVSVALRHGIGIHHGRLPRSLGRFMIRAFEERKLKILLCTSTLIEGVNTSAKNVIVFDGKLNNKPLDFFTFNNIRGRSGRMFQHFIGHVYVFDEPPQPELPFVDIPVFNPSETTPNSLLLQLPIDTVPFGLKDRVTFFLDQKKLSVALLKRLSSIEPEFLLEAADRIWRMSREELELLSWSSRPSYDSINLISDIIWTELRGSAAARQSALLSPKMMTFWIWELYKSQSVPRFRAHMIKNQIDSSKSPDDAVENVLAFLRGWASYNYPKFLMAVSDISNEILSAKGLKGCNYVSFAASIEHLFQPSSFSSLEEYGLPFEFSERLMVRKVFDKNDSLEKIINLLQNGGLDQVANGVFEQGLVNDFKAGLGRAKQN